MVSDPEHIDQLSRYFVQSVQGVGKPFNPDFNGSRQRSVGFYQFTNRNGLRSSSAYAYLAPLEDNPFLTMRLRSRVERIIVQKDRATGVYGATRTTTSTKPMRALK